MLPVYVINLRRRPDRWRRVAEQLERLEIKFTRIEAVDARSLVARDIQAGKPTKFNRSIHWRINLGSAAGMLSTSKALLSLLETDAPAALVLEDDAELAADVPALLTSIDWWPSGVHIVRLEESSQESPHWSGSAPLWRVSSGTTPSGRSLHRLERWCGGSAAYLIDRRGAQLALQAFADPDNTVDHTLFDMRSSKTARRMGTVQVMPAMARQCDSTSDQLEWRSAASRKGWARRWYRLRRNINAIPCKTRLLILRVLGLVSKTTVSFRALHDVDCL